MPTAWSLPHRFLVKLRRNGGKDRRLGSLRSTASEARLGGTTLFLDDASGVVIDVLNGRQLDRKNLNRLVRIWPVKTSEHERAAASVRNDAQDVGVSGERAVMKTIGVFVVLLLAFCGVARAQPASLAEGQAEGDRLRTAIGEMTAPSPSSVPETARLLLFNSSLRGGIREDANRQSGVRAAVDLGLSRFAQPRPPSQTRAIAGINRRLMPIPFLKWQHASPGVRNGMLTVAPSIALGRRPTILPDRFPGSRTFGVAVHVSLDLNRAAPAAPPGPAPTSVQPGLFARVRTLVEQNRH